MRIGFGFRFRRSPLPDNTPVPILRVKPPGHLDEVAAGEPFGVPDDRCVNRRRGIIHFRLFEQVSQLLFG